MYIERKITIVVQDQNKAVIPQAKVRLEFTNTILERQTDHYGEVLLEGISTKERLHLLQVTSPGFLKAITEDPILIGGTIKIIVTLELDPSIPVVDVTAEGMMR